MSFFGLNVYEILIPGLELFEPGKFEKDHKSHKDQIKTKHWKGRIFIIFSYSYDQIESIIPVIPSVWSPKGHEGQKGC